MDDFLALDLIRGLHLLCLIVGMGPALYYDYRSLGRIREPLLQTDLDELHRIHRLVSFACVGLWVSGAVLIWVRTGFQIEKFTPKLWAKLIIVSVLTVNAGILARTVIPALSRHKGLRLIDLPVRVLLPMTLCAGVSLSCWLLALTLGMSQTLKTADWDVLLLMMAEGAALCIFGIICVMFGLRLWLRRDNGMLREVSGQRAVK